MRRREFLGLFAGLGFWPEGALSQPSSMRRLAYVHPCDPRLDAVIRRRASEREQEPSRPFSMNCAGLGSWRARTFRSSDTLVKGKPTDTRNWLREVVASKPGRDFHAHDANGSPLQGAHDNHPHCRSYQ